jgi:hypothetical protein
MHNWFAKKAVRTTVVVPEDVRRGKNGSTSSAKPVRTRLRDLHETSREKRRPPALGAKCTAPLLYFVLGRPARPSQAPVVPRTTTLDFGGACGRPCSHPPSRRRARACGISHRDWEPRAICVRCEPGGGKRPGARATGTPTLDPGVADVAAPAGARARTLRAGDVQGHAASLTGTGNRGQSAFAVSLTAGSVLVHVQPAPQPSTQAWLT